MKTKNKLLLVNKIVLATKKNKGEVESDFNP